MKTTHLLVLLCAAALSACASKVRLDDLPAANERTGMVQANTYGRQGTAGQGNISNLPLYGSNSSLYGNNAGDNNGNGNGMPVSMSGGNNANSTNNGMGGNNNNGMGSANGTNGSNGTNFASGTSGASGASGSNSNGVNGVGNNGIAGRSLFNNGADQPNEGLLARRNVYFDYDSFTVRDDFKAILQAHAKNLNVNRNARVALEGNTDERGGSEYNLALGQKRANAVQTALQLLGVSNAQMEAVSFGKEKPKAAGSDEAGYAENRRVDIVYK